LSETSASFKKITYKDLNSRQKENYNFQKVSAVLADYGFVTLRLSDDWQGADFIAYHVDGRAFVKVQLKGRLTLDTKYKDKDIWICFNDRKNRSVWYLFPHDLFLRWALENLNVGHTEGWENPTDWENLKGVYSWPSLSKGIESWLSDYALTSDSPRAALETMKSG
jgi:hypothetical protein